MGALLRGWRALARACDRIAVAGIVAVIAVYKVSLSPLLGRHCRFDPTCSRYFREAVEKHGALRGRSVGSL
jgi:putative component of membrane protein insertase Oxa1/YidC/SpoIIIJ protein YidD